MELSSLWYARLWVKFIVIMTAQNSFAIWKLGIYTNYLYKVFYVITVWFFICVFLILSVVMVFNIKYLIAFFIENNARPNCKYFDKSFVDEAEQYGGVFIIALNPSGSLKSVFELINKCSAGLRVKYFDVNNAWKLFCCHFSFLASWFYNQHRIY